MNITDELFEIGAPHWRKELDHPFVRGIGDGSLPEAAFKRWVLQDYLYLIEYARVFAWAAAKADTLASMAWYAGVLDLTLNTEMDLHRRYAARFGISPEQLQAEPMWPTTRAYTRFLVQTARDGDMVDLLAALLPCTWGYVFIGRALATEPTPEDSRYADWIQQYADDEFLEALEWLKGELNRLTQDITEEKRARVREIFLTSVHHEWEFWEMCWEGEGPAPTG
jgi:thiaminase/transcriptional activator TenA